MGGVTKEVGSDGGGGRWGRWRWCCRWEVMEVWGCDQGGGK